MTPELPTAQPQVRTSDLVARVRALPGARRRLIGITGAPGSGKSWVAGSLAARLGDDAVVVPLDGFHLHDDELGRRGRAERKGAPDTFDVRGYVALLQRLRAEDVHTVYAPAFDRHRELSLAGAIAVAPQHHIVITEGNYLLHRADGWSSVRPLLDEVWYVEVDEETRLDRLISRHIAHGKDPGAARRWATTSDQANAELVATCRSDADLVVKIR